MKKWQIETDDHLVNPEVLKKLTAEQDAAVGTNYKGNKKFRWGYLDYLENGNFPDENNIWTLTKYVF